MSRLQAAVLTVSDRASSGRLTDESGPALERMLAGVRGRTLIMNLPGSLKGATESLEAVLPVLGHATRLLRGETEHR